MNGALLVQLNEMVEDIDVEPRSEALFGRRILLGISGGIAAVETVRLGRELRRHGAELHVIMTEAATRIISPLAVEWATRTAVTVNWTADMPQLGSFDGVLLAPATRNLLARHVNGIMDSPLLMALTSARSDGTPILFVPSMHDDLFDDPVTSELLDRVESQGAFSICTDSQEGRRKQPNPEAIVGRLCHLVNSKEPGRLRVVVTLGGNRAPMDAVREIRNTSSGATGFAISDHLYRMGHHVTCIVGTHDPAIPHLEHTMISATTHSAMSDAIISTAEDRPDAWVLAAAVLDYQPVEQPDKVASGQPELTIRLEPTEKLIDSVVALSPDSIVIGFKLEVGVDDATLVRRGRRQLERTGAKAVIANHLRSLTGELPRAFIVGGDDHEPLADVHAVVLAIERVLMATH